MRPPRYALASFVALVLAMPLGAQTCTIYQDQQVMGPGGEWVTADEVVFQPSGGTATITYYRTGAGQVLKARFEDIWTGEGTLVDYESSYSANPVSSDGGTTYRGSIREHRYVAGPNSPYESHGPMLGDPAEWEHASDPGNDAYDTTAEVDNARSQCG